MRACAVGKGLYIVALQWAHQPHTRLGYKEMMIHRRKAVGASPALRAGDRAIRSNSSASGRDLPEASGISASIPCAGEDSPPCGSSPFGVCAPRKLQALVTADILPAWLGGVWGKPQTPKNRKAQPFGSSSVPSRPSSLSLQRGPRSSGSLGCADAGKGRAYSRFQGSAENPRPSAQVWFNTLGRDTLLSSLLQIIDDRSNE
jgi:hypothetical protein